MSDIQLRDCEISTGGKRFSLSLAYTCPLCQQAALEDHWPPNYGGSAICVTENGYSGTESGSCKIVCKACRVAATVSFFRRYEASAAVENVIAYSDPVPLVEMDGKWLTPSDISDEEYKRTYGKYPMLTFA